MKCVPKKGDKVKVEGKRKSGREPRSRGNESERPSCVQMSTALIIPTL